MFKMNNFKYPSLEQFVFLFDCAVEIKEWVSNVLNKYYIFIFMEAISCCYYLGNVENMIALQNAQVSYVAYVL